MDLPTNLYGITALPNAQPLPTSASELSRGHGWRQLLQQEPDPNHPHALALQQMSLRVTPIMHAVFVQTLRRTVLGDDAPRLYLEKPDSLIRPSPNDIEEHSPATTPQILIPYDVEMDAYGAADANHVQYAREHARMREQIEAVAESMSAVHDRIRDYATLLRTDPNKAETRFKEILTLTSKAAHILAEQVEGASLADAAESVAARVETMLEEAMIESMQKLATSEDIRLYAQAARAMIREHLEPKPETAEIIAFPARR